MIAIPTLTPEVLAALCSELGGCDFQDQNQRTFLSCEISCDVQAAPGNGKTTLIVAKLALLSKVWKSRTEGVCVISHTNAARNEVERKLASQPTASTFLGYPHFIGTVTAFIDRFIALPYLRGLGWSIQRKDDDVFEAVARARYQTKSTLRASAKANNGNRRHQVEGSVS
jgi:DNA helicase-2/ATP-dependent DNA helicase PcrA